MQTLKSTGCVLDVRAAPGNKFVDVSRYHHAITNNNVVTARGLGSTLAGSYDGTSSYLDIGDIENTAKTVEIWLKPTSISVTEEILDLDGTHYIKATNGVITAEGFTSPTIYVNSIITSSISTNWNHIVITTSTAIDASDVNIGRLESSTYFNGGIFISRIYNRTLFAYEIENHYYEYVEYLGIK